MSFNYTRMVIEVKGPFYLRDWISDQNLFEEIIPCIKAE